MANLVITHTQDYIKIVSNNHSKFLKYHTKYYQKTELRSVELSPDDDYVLIEMKDNHEFRLSYDGNGDAIQVDSIQTAAPTSNTDLATKLSNLMSV